MIKSPNQEIEELNDLIALGLQEILHKGRQVHSTSIGSLEDDINLFMRALQLKNKIFDYATIIELNFMNIYEGKLAYSIVNTEGMPEIDKARYEELINFNF